MPAADPDAIAVKADTNSTNNTTNSESNGPGRGPRSDNVNNDDYLAEFADKDDNHHRHNSVEWWRRQAQQSTSQHRGFAFVTLTSKRIRDEAVEKGTVRGKRAPAKTDVKVSKTPKRKYTLYLRPIIREEGDERGDGSGNSGDVVDKNVCYLWSKKRCPYGDDCKFVHKGEGGCRIVTKKNGESTTQNDGDDDGTTKKKGKYFSFRSKGKCKLGDDCPYSHDVTELSSTTTNNDSNNNSQKKKNDHKKNTSKDKSTKDCINWKTKGKCRKMKNCPYRHDESVKKAYLMKKDVKLNKRKRDEAESKIKGSNDCDKKDSKEVVRKESKNKKGKKS